MEFQDYYIMENVNEWMQTILEGLATPQNYDDRRFAEVVKDVPLPKEFDGLRLLTYDHGRGKDEDSPTMLMTFAVDDEDNILYVAFGDENNPAKVINPMTGESQQDPARNPLYQRTVAKGSDGKISTKQIHPPFL